MMGIFRTWLKIILLLVFAYGAYASVFLGASHKLYDADQWQYYFYAACPYVLLFGALKAWHQNFIWRRMLVSRQRPALLARGETRNKKRPQGANALEYASIALVFLALAAILKQFGTAHIGWWIGALIGAWMSLKWMVRFAR